MTRARKHSNLIRAIIEEFASRFVPGNTLVHVGDTADKRICFDHDRLTALDVKIDSHRKMPDVVLHDPDRNSLVVVEAITGHGPIDNKRYAEVTELFAKTGVGIAYVSAFPSRTAVAPHLRNIALHTAVWVADEPSHMIHLDDGRLFGPHET